MTMTKPAGGWLGIAGETAVVTGAAGGIGEGVARALAEAGARVWILDRDQAACDAAAAEIGGDAQGLAFDAADRATIDRAAGIIGRCDILVNNAGVLRGGPLAEVAPEDWDLTLRINLTGYLACAQAFGAGMRARTRRAGARRFHRRLRAPGRVGRLQPLQGRGRHAVAPARLRMGAGGRAVELGQPGDGPHPAI